MAKRNDDINTNLRVLDEELDIALLPDEELLVSGEPNRAALTTYLMIAWTLISFATIFGIALLPFMLWAARVYARKHKYWITNNRVIVANGLIGYNVRSIPLERISDIAVRCSWLEKIFGLRSVIVRDMTGEAQAGATLMAVPDAPKMQAHLLDYVRQVNREAGADAPQKLAANPYRDVEPMGKQEKAQARMLEVLGRIEENTRHLSRARVVTDDDDTAAREAEAVHAEEEQAAAEAAARQS